MLKVPIREARIDQLARYERTGSVLAGTAQSGSPGIEVTVDIDSDAPEDRVAAVVHAAESTCYTHGALTAPVAVTTRVRLNGRALG